MLIDDAKKILAGDVSIISPEILQEAAKVILSELGKAEEKISVLEKKIFYCTEDLPGEIWKDIKSYEGKYQISNFGRVKSFQKGRVFILKTWKIPKGYVRVALYKNGIHSQKFIHVLIAQAFIPNPLNLPEVDHINNIPYDKRIENLRWATRSQNAKYAIEIGAQKIGVDSPNSKFKSEEDIRFIRENYKPRDEKFGGKALAKKFNVSPSAIGHIIQRRSYKNIRD